jgi:leucyl-tRNA synthetase
VINPDDVVKTYGADTLRVYEMFMGPFEAGLPWSTENIIGSRRFIERVWRLGEKVTSKKLTPEESVYQNTLHKTIQKVTDDIVTFSYNTAVSAMMIALNEMEKSEKVYKSDMELFLKILHPFAPHVTEELWKELGNKTSLVKEKWPKADHKKMKDAEITIAVQINGKVRGEVKIQPENTETEVLEKVHIMPEIQKWLTGQEVKKVIFVKNRLINIVI